METIVPGDKDCKECNAFHKQDVYMAESPPQALLYHGYCAKDPEWVGIHLFHWCRYYEGKQ